MEIKKKTKEAYCSTGAVVSPLSGFGTACLLAAMERSGVARPVCHLRISRNRASNSAAKRVARLLFTSPCWHVVFSLKHIALRFVM